MLSASQGFDGWRRLYRRGLASFVRHADTSLPEAQLRRRRNPCPLLRHRPTVEKHLGPRRRASNVELLTVEGQEEVDGFDPGSSNAPIAATTDCERRCAIPSDEPKHGYLGGATDDTENRLGRMTRHAVALL